MSATHRSPLEFLDDDLGSMKLTPHARRRLAQRGISEQELRYAAMHGEYLCRTGITFVFLPRCNIPMSHRRVGDIARLEGLTILISRSGWVKTAYINPRASRIIRQKAKCKSARVTESIHLVDNGIPSLPGHSTTDPEIDDGDSLGG